MEEKIDYYLNYPYSFNIKEFTDILNYIHLTCEFCNTSFSKSYHLNRHQKIHTKEKSHKCIICEKSFYKSPDITRLLKLISIKKN